MTVTGLPCIWFRGDGVWSCLLWVLEEMAAHSSLLAWRTPMDGGAGGLQSMGSQRVGHD